MTQRLPRLPFAIGLALAAIFGGCGDDDPPNGPVTPGSRVVALHGVRFKGFMGNDSTTVAPQFTVTDADGNRLANHPIQIEPVVGDGDMPRSIVTDAAGVAVLRYGFTGDMGHAAVRLYAEGTDTIEAYYRADAIVPGVHGQVGYVLFDDNYAEVKRWLGNPESEDVQPGKSPIYADYEDIHGLVVLLYDWDLNGVFYDSSSVYGVYVTPTSDAQTVTSPPLGIGAAVSDWRQVFGPEDYLIAGTQTGEWEYHWQAYDLIVWGSINVGPDTTAVQIGCGENVPITPKEIVALNGEQYRVTNLAGSNGLTHPELQFVVRDSAGSLIGNVSIGLETVIGNGFFLSGTGAPLVGVVTDSMTGIAEFGYFLVPGATGYAVARLSVPRIDPLDIQLRLNVLTPGVGGQGQYVLFDETYAEVTAWNGAAAAAAGDGVLGPTHAYAAYPDSGITFIFDDPSGTNQVTGSSGLHGIAVEAPWEGHMASASAAQRAIGIGSTYIAVTGAYGSPNSSVTVGDTLRLEYDSFPLRFDLVPATDGAVVRIVTWEGP